MNYYLLTKMFPVLFSISKISVSSFGVFLALGFVFGVFLIWRLSRAWDLDEEKILDLTLITFLGGLTGARIYFVLENLPVFVKNPLNILLFNKYPGFSFWGAFLGGWLILRYFAKQKKTDFWQVADIATIGFLGGLIFSSLGCFLGGCDIGIKNNSFFSVVMVGHAGKRFPVQILESFLLILTLIALWSKSKKFHTGGTVLGISLICIGIIKIITQPLKVISDEGSFLSLILIALGGFIFYKVTNRNIIKDLQGLLIFLRKFATDSLTRRAALVRLKKFWYSRRASFEWSMRSIKKNLRRLNVKFSYKNN